MTACAPWEGGQQTPALSLLPTATYAALAVVKSCAGLAQEVKCTAVGLRGTLPRCLRWEGPTFFSTLTEGETLQAVHALMGSALESAGHSFSGPSFPPQHLPSLLLHCLRADCPRLGQLAQAATQGHTSSAPMEPPHNANTLLNSQRRTVQMSLALIYSLHQYAAQNGDLFLFNQLIQVCAEASRALSALMCYRLGGAFCVQGSGSSPCHVGVIGVGRGIVHHSITHVGWIERCPVFYCPTRLQ